MACPRKLLALLLASATGSLAVEHGALAQNEGDEPAVPAGLDDDEPDVPAGLDDDEPDVPAGLDDDEPDVPAGLDDDEPDVPAGLEAKTTQPAQAQGTAKSLPFDVHGFADVRAGIRVRDDATEQPASLGEARVRIELERDWEPMSVVLRMVGDGIYDPVLGEHDLDLETGEGAIDLREASLAASPTSYLDVKIGRQILTWGTGDLLFINDLFPKDWNALLIGRDIGYLKAPSDAAKLSVFHPALNIDLVYTPRFDADRFPDRRRLSSWDPNLGAIAGRNAVPTTLPPDTWFDDAEYAARAHRRIGKAELALYGYYGFWKSPAGADPVAGAATFPALSVYGASARRPLFGGIANVEGGYLDSRDDRSGDDPLVRNSEVRVLAGYEHELARNLTGSAQYYLELMLDHDGYLSGLPAGAPTNDRARHVVTTRLTWLTRNQTLTYSLFVFASPSDKDAYLMPQMSYKFDDNTRAQLGGNILLGADDHTFFGQLRHNSNVYASLRFTW